MLQCQAYGRGYGKFSVLHVIVSSVIISYKDDKIIGENVWLELSIAVAFVALLVVYQSGNKLLETHHLCCLYRRKQRRRSSPLDRCLC